MSFCILEAWAAEGSSSYTHFPTHAAGTISYRGKIVLHTVTEVALPVITSTSFANCSPLGKDGETFRWIIWRTRNLCSWFPKIRTRKLVFALTSISRKGDTFAKQNILSYSWNRIPYSCHKEWGEQGGGREVESYRILHLNSSPNGKFNLHPCIPDPSLLTNRTRTLVIFLK